ncbi:SARP family transcriptional regulator [Actinomadura rubrobrunea]|uniref:SARP family transcriptional regulator n=1 Tax=Actinomadura rubrobrunea TaxID=115335 RepID=A0A9W6Q069_9ACTN|nr:BTAD domain-containing putative transcriptional regulator [Actinomadura rubrobrunea]GLW66163.1 SARP family transcriptional regulator [Actinomadura rubrobrunea]
MRFGVLGPVEARRDDGRVLPVGGPRARALLALLLLDAGRVVPAERLIDGLYGEHPPAGAANALQSQVSRLRKALGDAALVEGTAAGYRLAVAPECVDVHRFERLAREGRDALADGDHARAAASLREALSLWRGPALADVPLHGGHAARLEESRIAAVEDHAEAALALGEDASLVASLREVVDAHPLRERARGLLMRALYGSGRQAEALAVYEDGRRIIADELGADPSAELSALHLSILRGELGPRPSAPASPAPSEHVGLPAQLTSFVGREEELRQVGKLLAEVRLVTLLGPGGAGKTRLAVEAAARVRGPVCFVDLAPLGSGAEVPKALLSALGLRESPVRPEAPGEPSEHPDPVARLVAALTGRRMLLVLDNCEHVVEDAARIVHRLLSACPDLRVLATSREALGITGESLRPVPPLAVPPAEPGVRPSAAEALRYPAVRLFADRAAAVRPGFAVDDATVGPVLRICAALDGLPLAIELAAARLRTLPVAEVAARLDDRFRLLSRGSRAAAPRHQTLRAVVGWSWDLLDEAERRLARRLTVFAGGVTPEAAARVCGLPEPDADELLTGLADKSLLQPEPAAAGVRYRMLETVRAFCAERLEEAGERDRMRRAHAEYFLELARTADPHLRGPAQLEWLARLAAEHGNLHAALRRCVRADPPLALRLVAALSWYWWLRGRVEGAVLAAELLRAIGAVPPEGLEEEFVACVANAVTGGAVTGADADPLLRAASAALPRLGRELRHPATLVLWALTRGPVDEDPEAYERIIGSDPWTSALVRMSEAYVLQFGSRMAASEAEAEAALAGFRAVGDRWGMANSLDLLAQLAAWRGDRERGRRLLNEALDLLEPLGALEDTSDLLCRRGELSLQDGDAAAAVADFTAAVELARRSGAPDKIAAGYHGLGDAARLRGDLAEARRHYEAAVHAFGSERFLAQATRAAAHVGLGWVAASEGDLEAARRLHRRALDMSFDHAIFMQRAEAVVGLAGVALREGDAERAAFLLGAAAALQSGAAARTPDAARVTAEARELLGEAAFSAAFARGAALTPDEALAAAHA